MKWYWYIIIACIIFGFSSAIVFGFVFPYAHRLGWI